MGKLKIRQLTAFLLVAVLIYQFAYPAAASEHLSDLYISDLSVGTVEELEEAGYWVVNDNLNEGGTPVYLGYRLTTDPDEAITDVSALSMYGGYSPLSYKEQLLNDNEGVNELGTMLQTAAREFRRNYNDDNPFAEIAYDTLNAMMVPDDQGGETPLGEYLISNQRTLSDFKKLSLMCSNVVMSFILNQLCFGVADDTTGGESSWIDRLCENGPFEFVDEDGEEPDEGTIEAIYEEEYDSEYMQSAQRLYAAVASFTDSYLDAKDRSGSIEDMDVPDEDEANEAVEDICDAITEGGSIEFGDEARRSAAAVSDECGDLFPLGLYTLLDERDEDGNPVYPYGRNEDDSLRSLAEFFIEVGSMEDDEDAYRELYPLIVEQNGETPLTGGQACIFYLVGLSGMISVGCSDEEALEDARTAASEQVDEILDISGGEPVSVWYDVNTDIYDESQEGVYWTADFVREAAAHDRYDLLTKPTGIQEVDTQGQLTNAILYTSCVVVGALGAAMIASKIIGLAFAIKGLTAMVSCAVSYMASSVVAYSTAACVSCVIGTAFLAVLALAVVAILVIFLIKLFVWLFEDDEPELALTEIPKTMYDYNDAGEGSAVIYRVVNRVDTEDPANLNAGLSNTPWVALYYSKDKTLGEPIAAQFDGDELVTAPFTVSRGDQNPSEGYCCLTFFGSLTAANLNEGRSGAKGVFGFFHRQGDAVPRDEKQGQYLSEVKLTSASGRNREETAKAELIDSGYSVIDFNLTSGSSIAAYIGYKTSDDASEAITDLRVAYATGLDPNSAVISYGGAQYGCCGNAGNLLLMQSKWSCVGTPILASDLIVTDTLGDAPEGYEPVNLFCGGPAFDFNNCGSWEMTSEETGKEGSSGWKNHAFVYFNPSTQYTSGTVYLGGLAFFSGTVDAYMAEMGWTRLNNSNLGSGAGDLGITYDLSGVQDGKTLLCYSETCNPYRAIYDIQYYSAEASAQGLAFNLALYSGGAVACDVFQQSGGGVGDNRTIRPSHAYRSNSWYEGGAYYSESDYIDGVGSGQAFSQDADYVEWYRIGGTETASNVRCTGLYVVGCPQANTKNAEPIRISELVVSASEDYDADEMTPIRPITDAYAPQGANLAFNDLYHSGSMYLYLRRADPYAEIPTYLASVTVATVKGYDLDRKNGSQIPYDTAVYTLVGNGVGRLIEVNLTGDKLWNEKTATYVHEYIEGIGQQEWTEGQEVTCISHNTNYEVSLLWVTYTNVKTKGVSDLVIYESSDGTVPMDVKAADGASTTACGDGFRKGAKGTTYFLRAVYNAGNPITDLIVDSDVMLRNYWTSITTQGKASSYEQYYFKAAHFRKASLTYYISGIYTATGSSEKEALKALLDQGCRYFCPFNLSPDGKYPLYVGYSLSTSYKNAFSGLLLQDEGQNDTVTTIIKGRDTYNRVTDSLNSGVYDSIICMYLTNSVRKACETGGTKASNGHYITDITFYTDTDLNDYAAGEKSVDALDPKTRAYVLDYILDDDGEPVYWDIVTNSSGEIINCNVTAIKGGTLSETALKVYMYIHYSDNKTPYLTSLSGSLFVNNPAVSIIIIAGGALVLTGALYLLLARKKKASGAEPEGEAE